MKIVIEGAVIQNWLTKEVDRRVQAGGAGNADESISVRWIVLSSHPTIQPCLSPFSVGVCNFLPIASGCDFISVRWSVPHSHAFLYFS